MPPRDRDTPRGGNDASVPAVRPLPAVVEFVDGEDVVWSVTERDARRDPGARGPWCLIFASPDAVRRVWAYPVDWRELEPPALILLSRQR